MCDCDVPRNANGWPTVEPKFFNERQLRKGGCPNAIDKFGRGRSVNLANSFFDGLLPGGIETKIAKTDSLYGFGSPR